MLDADAPGAAIRLLAHGNDVAAEIENPTRHACVLENVGESLADEALRNGTHVDALSLGDLHHASPALAPDANLGAVDLGDRLGNGLIGRHVLAAEADLPEIYDRAYHRLEGAVRLIGNGKRLLRHVGDFTGHFDGLASAAIDLIERGILVD